jgi:hypothetical protein
MGSRYRPACALSGKSVYMEGTCKTESFRPRPRECSSSGYNGEPNLAYASQRVRLLNRAPSASWWSGLLSIRVTTRACAPPPRPRRSPPPRTESPSISLRPSPGAPGADFLRPRCGRRRRAFYLGGAASPVAGAAPGSRRRAHAVIGKRRPRCGVRPEGAEAWRRQLRPEVAKLPIFHGGRKCGERHPIENCEPQGLRTQRLPPSKAPDQRSLDCTCIFG